MATSCPIDFDGERLREQVLATYERVAVDPDGQFHFHRGVDYAHRCLGYDVTALRALPGVCTARFAGVGNPHRIGPIWPGECVLDHACGAGTDLLLAAREVGPHGQVIGVDMTPGMRACALQAAREAGLADIVDIRAGVFEDLPVEDASVDLVISNGVVNLSPEKLQVFREIHRVLKPGGRLYLSDVVVERELNMEARSNPDLWAACIAGALVKYEFEMLAKAVGLVGARTTEHFDCFRGTSAERKVASRLRVHGVNFFARKPKQQEA